MSAHVINTRIQSKYDTLVNWIESAQGEDPFTPLLGEICIVEIPQTNTAAQTGTTNQGQLTPPAIAIKVGDGHHTFVELPWIQALAGDVHGWAKAENKPVYIGSEILSIRKSSSDPTNQSLWTSPSVQKWLQDLTDDINSITGGSGTISTQIATALADLDVDNNSESALAHHITGFDPSKTLATLIEENGYIAATFQDIQIAESRVTNLTAHLDAKAPLASPAFTGIPTAPTATENTNTQQIATTAFVQTAVNTATAGLTGAMHFIGIATVEITDGSTTNPTISGYTFANAAAGDVVLYNNQEFVWTGSAWELLGAEGSYALNTVTISAGSGLTGGGTISSNQTISHAVPTNAASGARGTSGGRTYIQTITTDEFGHVTGATTATETVTDTTYTFAEGSTNGAFNVMPAGGSAQTVSIHGLGDAAYANIASAIDANNTDNLVTAGQVEAKVGTLADIAHTGSIYDVVEHNDHNGGSNENYSFLVFNCGSASVLIDSIQTT